MVTLLEPGHRWRAPLAGAIVAFQPVVAATSASLSPDALANAASACALACLVYATPRRSIMGLVGAGAFAAVAVACKDTAFGVVFSVLVALGLAIRRAQATARQRLSTWLVAPAIGGILAIAGWVLYRSPNIAMAAMRQGVDGPSWRWLVDVPATVVVQLPTLVTSGWMAVSNFGAHDLPVPAVVTWAAWLATALTVGGAWRTTVEARHPGATRELWLVLAAGFVATVLLAPLRQAFMGTADALQGRWLFPFAPVMAWWLVRGWATLGRDARVAPVATLAAVWLGLAPLVAVLVPHFYQPFPGTYDLGGLYLQGVYGRGADPERLLPFVTPIAGWLITTRGFVLGGVCLAGVGLVVGAAVLAKMAASPLGEDAPREDDAAGDHAGDERAEHRVDGGGARERL